MTIEALNCPNCGAGVASDSTECEFCKTRLKTMACPACFGLMFVGTQFCGNCGEKMVLASVRDADDLGNCPRCRIRLELLQIGQTDLRECHKCDGLWADIESFENICAKREEQSAVLGFIGERTRNAERLSTISYVPCPDCHELMNRSNFAHASGVIIDVCKKHGVWFDADELPKIIEFIQKGGMEIARRRELLEIKDQRDHLRDEQRKLGTQSGTLNLKQLLHQDDEAGIRGFLSRLFD